MPTESADHAASGHNIYWAYEGAGGPQAWGKPKPEFNTCAAGKRQFPINIKDSATLQGPAKPLPISYRPNNATLF